MFIHALRAFQNNKKRPVGRYREANIPYSATLQFAGEHCTIGNVLTFPKRQGIEESKPKVAKAFLRRDSEVGVKLLKIPGPAA